MRQGGCQPLVDARDGFLDMPKPGFEAVGPRFAHASLTPARGVEGVATGCAHRLAPSAGRQRKGDGFAPLADPVGPNYPAVAPGERRIRRLVSGPAGRAEASMRRVLCHLS